MPRIALAADHAGFPLKEAIRAHLEARGYAVVDFGTHSEAPVDYPDVVRPAAASVAAGACDLGVVCGGSGNGEAMAANKVRGVRCALCWSEASARLAREHNDANMIALGARLLTPEDGLRIVDAWLGAAFQGGRHRRRLAKLEPPEGP